MKHIWLLGGFGNVLFQYLMAQVLLEKGKQVKFVSTYTEPSVLTKTIMGLHIHKPLYDEIINKDDMKRVGWVYAYTVTFLGKLSKILRKHFNWVGYYFNEDLIEEPKSKNIIGYFQSKYFLDKHKEQLVNLGKLLQETYAKTERLPIVVHYRKGDSDWTRTAQEYDKKILEQLSQESEPILVVTDDKNKARENFKSLPNVYYSDAKSAIEDFSYMVSSQKLYLSSSTFSWWAAHTLPKGTQIVAPYFLAEELGFHSESTVNLL